MNDLVKEEYKEIRIIDLINHYRINYLRFLIYFLVPLLIGVSLFLYTKPFIPELKTVSLNIMIQNENVTENISKSYFFNVNHIREAVERSELSSKISVNKKLIESFDMISGHSELNRMVDDFIERDFLSMSKQLYFKPEVVESLRKDLISKGLNFRTIIFRTSEFDISKNEISILLSNLVDVINENISIDYDLANIMLKKIELLEINSPVSTVDVNKINSRLIIVREYIDNLKKNYGSFAPNINLELSLTNLESSEDLFNYLIQSNEIYKDIVESRLKLDLEAISKKIVSTNSVLETLDYAETTYNNSNDTSQNSNLSVDSSFIDTILSLGSSAKNMEDRSRYLEKIENLNNLAINLDMRLADLNLRTNFSISVDEAKDHLTSSLNDITKDINLYIDEVREIKSESNPIAKLSYENTEIESQMSYLLRPFLFLALGSFFISILLVTIRVFK